MTETWTFSEVASPNPLWRRWELHQDHMTVTFTATKDRRNQRHHERHVTVTFEREPTKLTLPKGAKAYAMAEKHRFMAQAFDTIGDLSRGLDSDEDALDLEVNDLLSQSHVSCTLEGDDALTVGACYFGNEFAGAVL